MSNLQLSLNGNFDALRLQESISTSITDDNFVFNTGNATTTEETIAQGDVSPTTNTLYVIVNGGTEDLLASSDGTNFDHVIPVGLFVMFIIAKATACKVKASATNCDYRVAVLPAD